MKRYNVHVAAIEPGMIPGTNLFTNPEFERSMNASFENAPQYVKDEFGDQVLNECEYRVGRCRKKLQTW